MPVRIQTDDFDLTTEIMHLRANNPSIGAIACFVGTVRDLNDGHAINALELEHYPGMSEKTLETLIAQARKRWSGIIDALIVHRVGKLHPSDQIVLVATTAAHRGDAFAACEFLVDYLKTRAPFWKKEQTPNGARWVDARATDDQALARWDITAEKKGNLHS